MHEVTWLGSEICYPTPTVCSDDTNLLYPNRNSKTRKTCLETHARHGHCVQHYCDVVCVETDQRWLAVNCSYPSPPGQQHQHYASWYGLVRTLYSSYYSFLRAVKRKEHRLTAIYSFLLHCIMFTNYRAPPSVVCHYWSSVCLLSRWWKVLTTNVTLFQSASM